MVSTKRGGALKVYCGKREKNAGDRFFKMSPLFKFIPGFPGMNHSIVGHICGPINKIPPIFFLNCCC